MKKVVDTKKSDVKKKKGDASPSAPATNSRASSLFRHGENAKPRGSNSVNEFVIIKADSSLTVTPLVNLDELISIDQHQFWDVNPAILAPCLGNGCPACAIGNIAKYKAFLAVAVKSEEGETQSKILVLGTQIARQLEMIAEEVGELKGAVLKVRRDGKGFKTKYTVIATGKRVNVDAIAALDPVDHVTVFSQVELQKKLQSFNLTGSSKGDDDDVESKDVENDDEAEW